jgi:hypothetical protein
MSKDQRYDGLYNASLFKIFLKKFRVFSGVELWIKKARRIMFRQLSKTSATEAGRAEVLFGVITCLAHIRLPATRDKRIKIGDMLLLVAD